MGGYPAYDYDYEIGTPFGAAQPQVPVSEPLPDSVEKALGTINNYLANPKQENISETKITTTIRPRRITTTTTTKPSTKRIPTTTKEITTTEIEPATTQPKRRKPTSSTDDAKDGNESNKNNVTIKSCKFILIGTISVENHATSSFPVLVNHGVSKSNIGFILDATYTWIISLILLICMCYRPQRGEPRSRQEADELFGTRATEESRIFKATFTVLLFFFNLLHWGMFISFSQVI